MTCKKCNATVNDNAMFCHNCGAKLAEEPAAPQQPKAESYGQTTVLTPEQLQQTQQAQTQPAETTVLTPDQAQQYAQPQQQYAQPQQQYTQAQQQYTQNQQQYTQAQQQYTQAQQQYTQAQQQYTQAQQQYNPNGFYTPDFNAQSTAKKSSSKKLLKPLLLIAIPVIAIALIVALNLNAITGFFIKTFGSDEKYFQFVEKNAFNSYTENVAGCYGIVADMLEGKNYSENKVTLNVSDDAIDMLEGFADTDLGFLKQIELSINGGTNNGFTKLETALSVNGQLLIDPTVIMDMDKQEIFLGVLSLSDKYIFIDGEDLFGGADMTELLNNKEVTDALPSEKEIDALLSKYVQIALDNMENVKTSNETLEVDGIKEKVTEVEFEFDTDNAQKIAVAVIEEALKDKKLEKYINDIAAALESADLLEDSDDVYDSFVDGLESTLEYIEDGDYENETLFVLTDYVNSKHEVVGRKVVVGEGEYESEVLYYATAHDGSKFATEARLRTVTLTGSGTDKNGAITGEFELKAYNYYDDSEVSILEITTESFNASNLVDGEIKGTIRLSPTDELFDMFGGTSAEGMLGLSLMDAGIEMIFDTKDSEGTVTLNLLLNDEMFVGVTVESKSKNAPKIKAPASKDTIEATSEDDLIYWLESVDADKLISALEDAELPDELVEMVEEAFENFVG